jgi:hypothetical protein
VLRRYLFGSIALLNVALLSRAVDARTVLLAGTRNGWIDAIDPEDLRTLARVNIGNPVESVSAMPDGRTLLVGRTSDFYDGCCGLFRLDLATMHLTSLLDIAQSGITTPDGSRIFTQRGNVGIDVFDGITFERLPTIETPGVYHLVPSGDGQWLYGTTYGPRASLDVFDIARNRLVHHIELPYELPRGLWLNGQFLMYALDGSVGRLWTLKPETTELGPGMVVRLPDLVPNCGPLLQIPIGSNARLFVYELFGYKLDRRSGCNQSIPGGVFEIAPASGEVMSHLDPEVHFGGLLVSHDGQTLYGIDVASANWIFPRLVKIDATSGKVLAQRALQDGVWSLSITEIPDELLRRF